MTALRFQTGGRHQASSASLRGKKNKNSRMLCHPTLRTTCNVLFIVERLPFFSHNTPGQLHFWFLQTFLNRRACMRMCVKMSVSIGLCKRSGILQDGVPQIILSYCTNIPEVVCPYLTCLLQSFCSATYHRI